MINIRWCLLHVQMLFGDIIISLYYQIIQLDIGVPAIVQNPSSPVDINALNLVLVLGV